ncbi:MAG: hypothetical protein GTO41_02280 [Burkholderiales bacterium]|nr:hypothetical protein [Burkholderiales bacterium]
MDQIESAVCGVCGVQPNELKSSLRSKRVSSARMLAMFLSRKLTSAAYSEIGQYFGGRSHSTVISAQRKVLNWMKNNQSVPVSQSACEIDEAIRRIESQLRAG